MEAFFSYTLALLPYSTFDFLVEIIVCFSTIELVSYILPSCSPNFVHDTLQQHKLARSAHKNTVALVMKRRVA